MKLKNFSVKYAFPSFISDILERTIQSLKQSTFRSSSQDHAIPRFFHTDSGDLYVLLLSPNNREAEELLVNPEGMANARDLLRIVNYDILLAPNVFESMPNYAEVKRMLQEESIPTVTLLNQALMSNDDTLKKHIQFN